MPDARRRRSASRAAGRRRRRTSGRSGRAAHRLSGRTRSSWRTDLAGAGAPTRRSRRSRRAAASRPSCRRAQITCICSAQSTSTGSSSHAALGAPEAAAPGRTAAAPRVAPRSSIPSIASIRWNSGPWKRQVAVGVLDRHRERRRGRSAAAGRGPSAAARRPTRGRRPSGSAGGSPSAAAIVRRERRRRRRLAAGRHADRVPAVVDGHALVSTRMSRSAGDARAPGCAATAASAISSIAHREREDGACRRCGGRPRYAVALEVEACARSAIAAVARRERRRAGEQRQLRALRPSGAKRRHPRARWRRRSRPRPRPCARCAAPRSSILQPSSIGISDHAAARRTLPAPRGDHARRQPRAPVDRDHAGGPAAVELVRELVEDLAGRRVVGLAAVAEAARHRAEEDEEARASRGAASRRVSERRRPSCPARARTSRAPCRGPACPRSRRRRGRRRRCGRGAA